jgi:ornithine cyclodeaminase/alanine dehydrogenase-like protein (mu-crystallin family)
MERGDLLYLSRADVEAVGLGVAEIVALVELALGAHGRGEVAIAPTTSLMPAPDTYLRAMAAHVPAVGAVGLKWLISAAHNPARGLPLTGGLLLLADPETAMPRAIMDAAWITALRSAAVTAVAAKYLARPDAATVAIVGAGVQGRAHLLTLPVVLPALRLARVYDLRPDATAACLAELAPRVPYALEAAPSAAAAIRGADVVVTATAVLADPHPFVEADWLAPGGLGAPLELDCAWQPAALFAADKFVTDSYPQLARMAEGAYQARNFPQGLPPLHAELGQVVCGARPGRESPAERIVALNAGLPIHDVTVGQRVYEQARARGVGTWLAL